MANSVLIFAQYNDEHACAVHYALDRIGVDAHLYLPVEIVGSGRFSVNYLEDNIELIAGSFEGYLDTICSSWNRRFYQTFRDPAFMHPADREHLTYGANSLNRGLFSLLEARFPVNPIHSVTTTSNKLNQVAAAVACGLRVPRTLISSSPAKVREFFRDQHVVCVKPYTGQSWLTEDGLVTSTTSIISDVDELSDDQISLLPHIFQEYIAKKYEVRVTVFGNFVAATKIAMPTGSPGSVDWKVDTDYLRNLEPYILDQSLLEALRKIMKSLDLRFGVFDIGFDLDERPVFFEVNECGQWLWQDIYCPETNILQAFAQYLSAADDNFSIDSRLIDDEMSKLDIIHEINHDSRYSDILGKDTDFLFGKIKSEDAAVEGKIDQIV